MATGSPPVLRFPISGKEDEFFLLEATPYGSKPLDLKLRGSEGSAVFAAKLRHKRIGEHKAATGHCTATEWEAILTSTLVDQKPAHDIEVRAEVPPDASYVELYFRKNVHGITQRLGAVKLSENPDEEVSPFNWCVSTIAARAKVEGELAAATARARALESSVDELKGQLRELIRAKEEDEARLLERFRDLLNEKKVKIRQQQRLLAAASVDPGKLVNAAAGAGRGRGKTAAARAPAQRRAPGASRAAKRKAGGAADDDETGEDDNTSGKMDVDDDTAAAADSGPQLDPEEDEPETTDPEQTASEAATDEADTDSGEDASPPSPPPPPPPKPKGKQATGGRMTRASASKSTASKGRGGKAGKGAAKAKPAPPPKDTDDDDDEDGGEDGGDDEEPPPPRSLPFVRGKTTAAPPRPAPVGDDDETESDDEL